MLWAERITGGKRSTPNPPKEGIPISGMPSQADGYRIFGITVDRRHALKWLFPQEKATMHAHKKSTLIPKVL
jgi:hypothetical protein